MGVVCTLTAGYIQVYVWNILLRVKQQTAMCRQRGCGGAQSASISEIKKGFKQRNWILWSDLLCQSKLWSSVLKFLHLAAEPPRQLAHIVTKLFLSRSLATPDPFYCLFQSLYDVIKSTYLFISVAFQIHGRCSKTLILEYYILICSVEGCKQRAKYAASSWGFR